MHTKAAILAAAITMAAGSAEAIVLYSDDFDGAGTIDAGVTGGFSPLTLESSTVGAWNAQGWSGQYLVNRTFVGGSPITSAMTTLSLSGLAAHTTVSMGFVLGFLESWDSYDGSCCSPDSLKLFIDGVEVASMTANNALGTIEDYDGGTELFDGVQVNGNTYFSDTLVNMSTAPFMTFAHTASTLTIGLQAVGAGWQGGSDEGFGLDSVVLTYDGVHAPPGPGIPEPGTWALMILGFGATGTVLRRRPAALA